MVIEQTERQRRSFKPAVPAAIYLASFLVLGGCSDQGAHGRFERDSYGGGMLHCMQGAGVVFQNLHN